MSRSRKRNPFYPHSGASARGWKRRESKRVRQANRRYAQGDTELPPLRRADHYNDPRDGRSYWPERPRHNK